MNRTGFACCLLVASLASAQEIGKEIPADAQQSNAQSGSTNYDNPYATPPPPPPSPEKKDAASTENNGVPGPRKMTFGLNAGFGGGGLPFLSTAGGAGAGPAAPTIGLKLMATERLGVNFDLGFGLGLINGNALFGFGLGMSIDAYLGKADSPIKPFITGGASFGKGISQAGDDFSLGFNVGGGGEYWFNDHFSVNGRALIGVPIALKSGLLTIATFTPGVGATFYF